MASGGEVQTVAISAAGRVHGYPSGQAVQDSAHDRALDVPELVARLVVPGRPGPMLIRDGQGRPALMHWWDHRTSDYLAAALPLGFTVRACLAPARPDPLIIDASSAVTHAPSAPSHDPAGPPNIWAVHAYSPRAVDAAYAGRPLAIIWHFQLDQNGHDS